jgi:hypothetical protein
MLLAGGGNEPIQLNIFGFVNDTHPATAQLLDAAAMGYHLTDELGGRSHCRECYEEH